MPAIAALTTKPCRDSARAELCISLGLAAEQMRAAGDVEKQAMRQIQRHQRRETVAPVGDVVDQHLRIRGRIGVEHLDVRTDRAGIGERQADFEAEFGGGIVQRGNLQRVVLLGDDDAGLRRLAGAPLRANAGA